MQLCRLMFADASGNDWFATSASDFPWFHGWAAQQRTLAGFTIAERGTHMRAEEPAASAVRLLHLLVVVSTTPMWMRMGLRWSF
jgi:hypothetical protein